MSTGSLLIHARPGRTTAVVLSWMLFAVGIAAYLYVAQARHLENPDERVTPTVAQMVQGMLHAALQPADDDEAMAEGSAEGSSVWRQFAGSMLWKDTKATARRFALAMLLLVPAVLLGLHMGLFPYAGVFFLRFVLFFDKIVALSLLPVLFIVFGIDELSKIALIVIGVAPTVILDTFNLTRAVPGEQIVKAFTLGAGDFDVAYRVVLKQILPRVLNSIRLNLKAVMLFLFAGEMIASTDGLAYRIALLRRQMGMDVIIPYVLWVALLLFLVDLAMRRANRLLHPWFREA
jgi:NitT/TauT family transport system permease protein